MNADARSSGLLPARVAPVVATLAVLDWAIAMAMTVTGTRREVAVPVLAVAVLSLVALQRPWLVELIGAVRRAGSRGDPRWTAAETVLARRWSPRVARLALQEPRLLWSLVLLVRRRRDGVPDDGSVQPFAAHADALPAWLVLGGLGVVELAVTPLFPLPAPVHTVLLVVGVWGLTVIAGATAALVVHPHLVDAERVRLRFGFWQEVVLSRDAVRSVRGGTASAERGLVVADGEASLGAAGATNAVLELREAVSVRGEPVRRVRVWVDDPVAFAAAIMAP